MADVSGNGVPTEPDPDLIEYVLVTATTVAGLERLVPSVLSLVESDVVRVLDVLVLSRRHDQVGVDIEEADEVPGLAALTATIGEGRLLSEHDVDLAATVLEPGVAALLLLIEDRWAAQLARVGRDAGARVSAGERVTRHRFLKVPPSSPARSRHGGMLVRPPAPPNPVRVDLAIDHAAQLRELVDLVRIGVLSFDQYEDQRRRVLGG